MQAFCLKSPGRFVGAAPCRLRRRFCAFVRRRCARFRGTPMARTRAMNARLFRSHRCVRPRASPPDTSLISLQRPNLSSVCRYFEINGLGDALPARESLFQTLFCNIHPCCLRWSMAGCKNLLACFGGGSGGLFCGGALKRGGAARCVGTCFRFW